MVMILLSSLGPRVEQVVRKWRDEIPSMPASFFSESEDDDGLPDSVLLPLMLGCVLTGLVGGFLVGMESARPQSTVVQTSFEAGYEDGLSSLPDGQPEVLFRQDGLFNRSIAIVYPDHDLSYECVVSRRTLEDGGGEWAIDRQAYKYNGTVDCATAEEILISEYNNPEIKDTLLRNEISIESRTEENQ